MYLDKIIEIKYQKRVNCTKRYNMRERIKSNYIHSWRMAGLEDGRLELTNNLSECSQKPVIIGRKNSMFMGSARGAQSSAVIYSLVEREREWIGTKVLPESPVGRTSENGRGW